MKDEAKREFDGTEEAETKLKRVEKLLAALLRALKEIGIDPAGLLGLREPKPKQF